MWRAIQVIEMSHNSSNFLDANCLRKIMHLFVELLPKVVIMIIPGDFVKVTQIVAKMFLLKCKTCYDNLCM